MTDKKLSAEEVIAALQESLGERFHGSRIAETFEGASRQVSRQIWARIDRRALRSAIRRVMDIQFPHLAVISGVDIGDSIELIYHLYIYYGARHTELGVFFTLALPKEDLTVDTITDLIPGALIGEREKQEMLGIQVNNIPDGRRMFLPQDFPVGIFPWRKDEKGIPESMIRNLWQTGRPENKGEAATVEAESK